MKKEKDEVNAPRIPSWEEQFQPEAMNIGGWSPSTDPHESPIVELPTDGGVGIGTTCDCDAHESESDEEG